MQENITLSNIVAHLSETRPGLLPFIMSAPGDCPVASVAKVGAPLEMISQGAEARVYASDFCGRPSIVKERFRKLYRLPELDEKLTQRRIKQEVRCFVKAKKAGVDTPCLYMVDMPSSTIHMERILGGTVKAWLRANHERDPEGALRIAYGMGVAVAKLHDGTIVHGDLTTSNMMLRPPENTIVVIDFGLSSISHDVEERAVDLYLMEKAIVSSHANADPLVAEAMRAYKATCKKADAVLQRLAAVRQRGRKRDMIG